MRRLLIASLLWLAACDNGFLTQQGYEPAQPISFSHALHAGEMKMSCQYCHFGAAQSRHSGVPPVSVCMGCHLRVKTDSPEIQKLTKLAQSGKPIEWTRVHRLPDFVWFSHQDHIAANVACDTCHGPVETMTRVQQFNTMTMGWCLDCHRKTAADPANAGKLNPPTDCSACHR